MTSREPYLSEQRAARVAHAVILTVALVGAQTGSNRRAPTNWAVTKLIASFDPPNHRLFIARRT